MLHKIFGTGKKDTSSKVRARDGDAAAASAAAADRNVRTTATSTPAATTSAAIPVVTTRTTSPIAGRRGRSSLSESSLAASHRSRSDVASPSSPLSPPQAGCGRSAGRVRGGEGFVPNLSITVRSDPVPAGFRTSTTSSRVGSPKGPLGSLASTSMDGGALTSPLHPAAAASSVGGGAAPSVGSAASTADTGGRAASRPIPMALLSSRGPGSPAELQFSRTVPAFGSSPLLFGSASRSGNFARNGSGLDGPAGTGSGGGNSSSVNYWRLPWTQQRIVMCPYCNRPQYNRQLDSMNSHGTDPTRESDHDDGDEDYVAGGGRGAYDGRDDASSRSSSDSSSVDGGGRRRHCSGLNASMGGYCRCAPLHMVSDTTGSPPAANASGAATGAAGARSSREQHPTQQQHPPPVFIVETVRSSKMVVPGTIADDATTSDDDDDEDKGCGGQRRMRLSLVSPLMSSMLQRNSYPAVHSPVANDRHVEPSPIPTDSAAAGRSFAKSMMDPLAKSAGSHTGGNSVASWIEEQQLHRQPITAAEKPATMVEFVQAVPKEKRPAAGSATKKVKPAVN